MNKRILQRIYWALVMVSVCDASEAQFASPEPTLQSPAIPTRGLPPQGPLKELRTFDQVQAYVEKIYRDGNRLPQLQRKLNAEGAACLELASDLSLQERMLDCIVTIYEGEELRLRIHPINAFDVTVFPVPLVMR